MVSKQELEIKVDGAIAKIADQIKAQPDSLKAMQFGQAAAHLAYALSMRLGSTNTRQKKTTTTP